MAKKIKKPVRRKPASGGFITPKQAERIARNERIRFDFNTQIKINGSTTMGVVAYLADQYKVSEATVFRCIK